MSLWYCEKCKGLSTPLLDESGEVKKLFCGVCVKVTNHVLHIAIPRSELEELVKALESTAAELLTAPTRGEINELTGVIGKQTAAKFKEKYLKP